MKKYEILTDDFLADDLQYALGRGEWNTGDGHCWIFSSEDVEDASAQIIANFTVALEKLFHNNHVVFPSG